MTEPELLYALDTLQIMMRVVAKGPGGMRNNDEFEKTYALVAHELSRRGIDNPLPYEHLYDWAEHCEYMLPNKRSRLKFVAEIFKPLMSRIRTGRWEEVELTGWLRVDRTVGKIRNRLAAATTEEEFQAVGLLGREALISLAQAVYVPERHPTLNGVEASSTDAKRMLEAYISTELGGGANDEARKHARSALDLAVTLQHNRTATFRDAAMCAEATTSVVNIVAIVSGRRDPQ